MSSRRKEILRLIEETMTKTRSYENATEAINEQWIKLLILYFLHLIQMPYNKISK